MPAGMSMILIGIALSLVSRLLDGFVYGMVLGAAVALIMIGVIVLSARWRGRSRPGAAEDATWLPSRDGNY